MLIHELHIAKCVVGVEVHKNFCSAMDAEVLAECLIIEGTCNMNLHVFLFKLNSKRTGHAFDEDPTYALGIRLDLNHLVRVFLGLVYYEVEFLMGKG